MIYRIASDGSSLSVETEDTSFSIPTKNREEALSLIRKAQAEGIEAIRPKKKGK